MKKLLLLALLLLASCAPPVSVKVYLADKSMTEQWTEHDPGGYKYTCGLTVEGKYKCGFHYFLPSSNIHPATYTFHLYYNDCPFSYGVNEQEYYAYEVGSHLTMEVSPSFMGDCYQEK